MDYGLIVDVETTGLDATQDKVIELGLLEFAVHGDAPPSITRMYGGMQDPGVPLSAEITRITGITDAMVGGQAIDRQLARDYFGRAALVVAHNAAFDRGFLERSGLVEGLRLHWACSMRHIDWQRLGHRTLALNYLAADHGFVNPFPHRALFDCATTFKLIAPHLAELTARSYEREVMIRAVKSPFDSKDVLRARGYRWNTEERVWWRVVAESVVEAERSFLATDVYRGVAQHEELFADIVAAEMH